MDVYGISEKWVFKDYGVLDYFYNDLNVEENRKILESKVDMDDYIRMYAIAFLLNHTDWPANNFEAWKYNGSNHSDSEYTDGRIRFLLKDFDNTISERQPGEGLFLYIMNQEESLFSEVMKSEYYKSKFLVVLSDLEKTVFCKENVNKLVDELSFPVIEEMRMHYSKEMVDDALVALDDLKAFNSSSKNMLHPQMEQFWNLDKKYTLNVTASKGVKVYCNNIEVSNGSFSNDYFTHTIPELNVKLSPGYSITRISVNGNAVEGDSEMLSSFIDGINDTDIEIIAERNKSQVLVIDSIKAEADADSIILYNAGIDDVNLSNYYISDDEDIHTKFRLPAEVLAPGDVVTLYGKKALYRDKRFIFGFSLNEKETVYLYSGAEDKIVDSLSIPRMCVSESYGRFLEYSDAPIGEFFHR